MYALRDRLVIGNGVSSLLNIVMQVTVPYTALAFITHVTAGSNVKVNTRCYLIQYSHSTFSPVQKNVYFIGYVEKTPRAFKACSGLGATTLSNSYLAHLPRPTSQLQQESHAFSAVLLNI